MAIIWWSETALDLLANGAGELATVDHERADDLAFIAAGKAWIDHLHLSPFGCVAEIRGVQEVPADVPRGIPQSGVAWKPVVERQGGGAEHLGVVR